MESEGEDRQQQQQQESPCCCLIFTHPFHTTTSRLPLPLAITSDAHFTPSTHFVLIIPFLGWRGDGESTLWRKEKESTAFISKQTHLAFQIPISFVTFLFQWQTKLGKKSWDSSLPPDSAYMLFSGKTFPLVLLHLKILGLLSSGAGNFEAGVFKFP